ncbi:hypothetical protein TVAG_459040 [Trichomonas vaginalis G3]|uniref:Glycosyltransferase 61 catalytic domain-containing protein n=1 Tax=Trichomonas vaginalis (strain ATCC PRA-98 / G3) TaxID=412133 RepID=A2E6A9_TRIV3|nr:glycosyltransferase family [Trichomonas vaginalis G3]EAY11832.1 hypothetical protein TVAG_459040 [Trichomonas vaginalis G3]KAI5534250.1 glycosyltransferase family [Trichomonas vaginalis G3]|eukprot:XP_001324055.1 hypothetical protein [Trichomonas vaginalis G3]
MTITLVILVYLIAKPFILGRVTVLFNETKIQDVAYFRIDQMIPFERREIVEYLPENKEGRQMATKPIYFGDPTCFRPALVRQILVYYHLKDVYLTKNNMYSRYGRLRRVNNTKEPYWEFNYEPEPLEHVCWVYSHLVTFGHWLTDGIATSMIYFPRELMQKSKVIIRRPTQNWLNYLKEYGFDIINYYELKNRTVYKVKNLYTFISPDPYCSLYYSAIQLRKQIHNFHNLTNLTASVGAYTNRKGAREIFNMEDIINLCRATYPNIQWINLTEKTFYTNLSTCIKTLGITKYYITGTGSNVFHCIYMKEDSGVVVIGTWLIDYPFIGLAKALGIWMMYVCNHNIKHSVKKIDSGAVNISFNFPYIQRLVYAVNHGYWPQKMNPGDRILFNLTLTREIVKLDKYRTYYMEQNESVILQELKDRKKEVWI